MVTLHANPGQISNQTFPCDRHRPMTLQKLIPADLGSFAASGICDRRHAPLAAVPPHGC